MRPTLLLTVLAAASGFKFMSNWKMPTVGSTLRARHAKEKFGDKKLVVVTGTSSGLGRATARALLRTGQCVPCHRVVSNTRTLPRACHGVG
tara:strand:+ start:164 stop:436 length:273 start_codon:yes stop_codon:yes gene_type:complete